MDKLKATVTRTRVIAVSLVVLLCGAAFAGGFVVSDDSSEVDSLKNDLAAAENAQNSAEDDLAASEAEIFDLEEELDSSEEQLQAERSLNGKVPVANAEETEYETDFPWGAAGKVGYLTLKPTSFRQEGSRWILEVEAKNESSEPKTPFCGDAGAALGDSLGNTYTGETVISEASDSCEELQPGLTGIFMAEFKLPEEAEPAVAGIYGDWEQEEEAKFWALP